MILKTLNLHHPLAKGVRVDREVETGPERDLIDPVEDIDLQVIDIKEIDLEIGIEIEIRIGIEIDQGKETEIDQEIEKEETESIGPQRERVDQDHVQEI